MLCLYIISVSLLKFLTPVFIYGDNPNKILFLSTAVTETLLKILSVYNLSI